MSQSYPTPEEIEAYAQAYLFGSPAEDQSKAWRIAFPTSKASEKSVWQLASKFHSILEVQSRIRDLRIESAKIAKDKHDVTVDSLILELEEARDIAKENGQSSALVSATLGKAKLAGLDVQKVDHTSSDGSMTPARIELVAPSVDKAD